MPSVIGKRLGAGFGLAIVLLIANAFVSFQATNTLDENNKKVVQTLEAIETLSEVIAAITTAESSQRGFIITGEEHFLRIYSDTSPKIDQTLSTLKNLTGDNPQQNQRVAALEEAVNLRRETLERNLELRKTEGLEYVLGAKRMQQGTEQMAEVNRIANEIEEEEDRLLAVRSAESEASSRNTILTFVIANALVLGLLGAVYYLIVGDLRERERSAQLLREAHDRLEERVRERTLELNDMNTELERSNRELQDFAFVASHDLQEPLRKIQAFGDRLKTKHGPEMNDQARDYLERMHNAAGRMHTLINDLLTFSRVTTKAQPFQPTDLKQVAEDVMSDLETTVEQAGGSVELGELPKIDADPLQMRQLIQNLTSNALKFRKPGVPPIIKIKGKVSPGDGDGPVATLTVEDNGIGFDEKYLDRIFTPFQRLHGRGEYAGTGIGLAVCRKIVERHGGTLTACSKPDVGSTFIATLPVKQDKE